MCFQCGPHRKRDEGFSDVRLREPVPAGGLLSLLCYHPHVDPQDLSARALETVGPSA